MNIILCSVLILVLLIKCGLSLPFAQNNSCFRAAVFEHVQQRGVDGQQLIDLNLNVYQTVVITASAFSANIVVFPEYGIFFNIETREDLRQYVEQIPNPSDSVIACDAEDVYKQSHPILYRLSCLAKNYSIYIAADMGDSEPCNPNTDPYCRSDGFYYYNTAVLFDSSGLLLAKYHKMNLYGEAYYDEPLEPEIIAVDTPFGRLGLQICFDMIYKMPGIPLVEQSNIDTMLFPTWWFDSLPFLASAQYQEGWAVTNKVNLLASNIHLPQVGSLGSGIYSGDSGAILYTNTPNGDAVLLIAEIPVSSRVPNDCIVNSKTIPIKTNQNIKANYTLYAKTQEAMPITADVEYRPKYQRMDDTDHYVLLNSSSSLTRCQNEFCCQLEYSLTDSGFDNNESYYLIIANRTRPSTNPWCEEYCALVRCDTDAQNQCSSFPTDPVSRFKSVSISATFSTKYVYPSVMSSNIALIDRNKWQFSISTASERPTAQLIVDNLNQPIMTFGLYGRCYDRDPPKVPQTQPPQQTTPQQTQSTPISQTTTSQSTTQSNSILIFLNQIIFYFSVIIVVLVSNKY